MPKCKVPVSRSLVARRTVQSICEQLETRAMLSVSVNASGMTVVTPSGGDRIIYCSSSTGKDTNNGLTPQTAVATPAKGASLLHNNSGDELLFKAGDVWNVPIGYWTLSGASAQNPMLISSYGSGPRPEFLTGANTGFVTGRPSSKVINYVDLMNINFVASARDPNLTSAPAATKNPMGIELLTISNDILIENCETQYYTDGINIEKYWGTIQNISVRRCVVIDSYAVNDHAEGLYALGVNGLTLDGNYFGQNGYNNQVPGATVNWYNHDVYLNSSNTGCVVENNIFAQAAGYGLQDRPGGIVKNNLFIDNPIGMTYGVVNGAATTPGGVSGAVTGNVFIGGSNLGTMRAGEGLVLGNIKPGGTVVSNNIFTQSIPNAEPAIALDYGSGQPDPQDSVGINDLSLVNNIIYSWTNGIDIENNQSPGGKGLTAFNNVSFIGNQFENIGTPISNHNPAYTAQEHLSGNVYYNTGPSNNYPKNITPVGTVRTSPIPFPNPNASIVTYDQLVKGGASVSAFFAAATQQNELNWNPAFTASAVIQYIDAGFGMSSSAPTSVPTSVPPASTTAALSTSVFQGLNYVTQSGGMKSDSFKGLGYISGGGWVEYGPIDFGAGVKTFKANIAAMTSGGSIQLRLDSTTGPIVGTLKISATGAWSNYTAQSTAVSGATGKHALYLVFVGGAGVCNLENFTFA